MSGISAKSGRKTFRGRTVNGAFPSSFRHLPACISSWKNSAASLHSTAKNVIKKAGERQPFSVLPQKRKNVNRQPFYNPLRNERNTQ